jgi:hypothetical protein
MVNMEWVPPKPRLQRGGVAIRPFRASDAVPVASACRDPDILRFTRRVARVEENTAADGVVLERDQIDRLNSLTPAAGDRHDEANMARVDH